ncbi:MAG: ABC transporter permease [Candidatus Babeliales bacterium]
MKLLRKIAVQELYVLMMAPALLWQLLFFYCPLLFIIFRVFWVNGLGISQFAEHVHIFTSIPYFLIIGRSLLLAMITAVCSFMCAYPVAYYLAFCSSSVKNILFFFLMVPFWTNFLVQVYAWFFVLSPMGLLNSFLSMVGWSGAPLHLLNTDYALYIVMVYSYIPFMIFSLYISLEKLDKKLLEASLDLGATPLKTFFAVTIPLSSSGIISGFFLVFIPAFCDFVIPIIVGGGKKIYVGTLLYHYFIVTRDVSMGASFILYSGIIFSAVLLLLLGILNKMIGSYRI